MNPTVKNLNMDGPVTVTYTYPRILRKGPSRVLYIMLSVDLSSLPTIILRRFLFTNDPAYLLLSVALGDVFFIAPTFALRYPVHVA